MFPDPPSSPSARSPAPNKSGLFPLTMWSMIQAARTDDEALEGLERLARAYWRPLHVFARQRGMGEDAAADAVQGFFERLLSQEMLRDVQRGEVRFRSFLLRCFTNWLHNEHDKATAAKRGGTARLLRVDELGSGVHEPALMAADSPDQAYDRGWARAMVDQAMRRLDEEIAERDRSEFFQELRRRTFATDGRVPDWEELARRFGMNHGAVRKASSDLRRRFSMLLRAEVRALVSKDEEVDDELRYLVGLLSAH